MTTFLPAFFRYARYVFLLVPGWLSLTTPDGFAQPTVVPPANQAVCVGTATGPISFTGTGRYYTWTNSDPSIGLPASGVGKIPSFIAQNNFTRSPKTATITVTPSRPACAYIANAGSDNVTVINTNTNQVITTIPVGDAPTGVSVSPDGNRVYVTNNNSNTVSVIDADQNAVIATIPVGQNPIGICVTPNGNQVYVANYGNSTVSVINAATNTVTATITNNMWPFPNGIAVNADGTRIYVACRGAGDITKNPSRITVISTATNQVIYTQDANAGPIGVAVNPVSGRIYTADNSFALYYVPNETFLGPSSVTVFNPNNLSNTEAFIPVGLSPYGVCVSPDGSRLYVSVESEGTIKVINTTTNTVSATITVGAPSDPGAGYSSNGTDPRGVSLSADGSRLYVACRRDRVVKVINTVTNSVIATIDDVGSTPISLGNFVGPAGTPEVGEPLTFTITVNPLPIVDKPEDQAVCPSVASLPVTFSGTANSFTWTNNNPAIGLPASGTGTVPSFSASTPQSATLTVTPRRAAYAYVPTYSSSGSVKVINTQTRAIVATIPVGQFPKGVSVSADGTLVYVVNGGSGTVSVISTATNTVLSTISVGASPFGAVVSPDGHFVYVSNSGSGTVSVISTATNTIIATVTVGDRPMGVVITPDGSRVYVANYGSNTVSVINTVTRLVTATIAVNDGPISLCTARNNVYVVSSLANKVSEIIADPSQPAYHQVVVTTNVGRSPYGVSANPSGSQLYVTNSGDNSVTVVRLPSFSTITFPVGSQPTGVNVSEDGSRVYIANAGSTNVNVLDAATNQVLSTIDVGGGSQAVGNFVGPTGCSGTPQTFVIAVKNSLTASISGPLVVCTGRQSALVATGGGTYVWNTGATSSSVSAATAGVYSVTVSSGQCTATATASVTTTSSQVDFTSLPPSSIEVNSGTDVSIPVGVSGDYAYYQWLKDGVSLGASQQTSTLTLPNIQFYQAGYYNLQVTNVCNSITTGFALTIIQATRYVNEYSSGRRDGSSWANASSNLQAMIDGYKVSQVWVATGLYKPTDGSNRTISFHMKSGVAILGGFPASGTPTLADRNPTSYTTTLSGDINTQDVGTFGDLGTIQIIHNEGVDNTGVLDGFIIRDGYLNAQDYDPQRTPGGSGMYNANSSPRVINCMFLDNFSTLGGAMYNVNSHPTLINCVLYGNYVYDGGTGDGIYNNSSSLTMINCTLTNDPRLRSQTIRNENNSSTSLTNCIIWNGDGIDDLQNNDSQSSFTANNCLIDAAETDFTGANNLTTDPKFIDPGSLIPNLPFYDIVVFNLQLKAGSPAINAGSNLAYTTANGPTIDLGASPRILGGTIDIGAYELRSDLIPLLYTLPSTAYGTTPVTIVIEVTERNAVTTGGLTTVHINKDPMLTLSLNPGLSLVGGRQVQNSQWHLDSSDPDFYILTTTQPIVGASRLSVGLSGELRPGSTKGSLTVSGAVVNSIGEASLSNNADADKIEYFQK